MPLDIGFDLERLWGLINPRTLYQMQLGYRGSFVKDLESKRPEALALQNKVVSVQTKILADEILQPMALWDFFKCDVDGNTGRVTVDSDWVVAFPRQARDPYCCLADFISDEIGLMVVTMGGRLAEVVGQWHSERRYQEAVILNAIGLQSAEALAEWVHFQMRQKMGVVEPAMTVERAIETLYEGRRFSFGYGACPNLADQDGMLRLLGADRIGVELTDVYMMRPQASVSAMVIEHTDVEYFLV